MQLLLKLEILKYLNFTVLSVVKYRRHIDINVLYKAQFWVTKSRSAGAYESIHVCVDVCKWEECVCSTTSTAK